QSFRRTGQAGLTNSGGDSRCSRRSQPRLAGAIWRTAWIGSLAFALIVLATAAIYAKFKNYYEEKVAEKIIATEQVTNYNKDTFRELAIAGVPVSVVRTESYGVTDPGGFALVIEDADR